MLYGVDGVLERIEAMPGTGRYAVTFRRRDGGEHTAVVHTDGSDVHIAEANLPDGWSRGSSAFLALTEALSAIERARSVSAGPTVLRDVDGGWDVGLGNVIVDETGLPVCTAHGPMVGTDGVFECTECGARAAYAS